MDNTTYLKIENVLYNYACGKVSAFNVKKRLWAIGYKIDLRKWLHNVIEVESRTTGELTEIEV